MSTETGPGIDLRITPEGTEPPFESATALLNAVLPHAKEGFKLGIFEHEYIGTGIDSRKHFFASATHFFPDGIVGLSGYDRKSYKNFVEGKAKSYVASLSAAIHGASLTMEYWSIARLKENP